MGEFAQYQGIPGVGGYPSSHMLAISKTRTGLVQNTFIFILTKKLFILSFNYVKMFICFSFILELC